MCYGRLSPELNEPEVDEEIEDNNSEDNYDEDNYDVDGTCKKMTACARNNLVVLFYFMRALALLFPSLYVNIDRSIDLWLLIALDIYLYVMIAFTTRCDAIQYNFILTKKVSCRKI